MLPYIFAAVSGIVLVLSPATLNEVAKEPVGAPLPAVAPVALPAEKAPSLEKMEVWVTAYSSTPEETDSTPFTTAMNSEVHDGVVAANFLPFGTKIRIPEYFGDKVFTVEDRMHRRKTNFVDIWMPTKEDAKDFGIAYTDIVILERGNNSVATTE